MPEGLKNEHINIGYYTASIYKWKLLLKPDKYKQLICNSLKFLVNENRATIYAFVIMPNHLHLLWKINPEHSLENLQRDFIKYTSQMIKFDLQKDHTKVLEHFRVDLKDRTYQFWQRNSLNKLLKSRKVIEQKLDYIHNNPVRGK